MKVEPQQLKAFLIDAGLVNDEKFEKILAKSKTSNKKIGDVLIAENELSHDELVKLEAYILGIPFIRNTVDVIEKAYGIGQKSI